MLAGQSFFRLFVVLNGQGSVQCHGLEFIFELFDVDPASPGYSLTIIVFRRVRFVNGNDSMPCEGARPSVTLKLNDVWSTTVKESMVVGDPADAARIVGTSWLACIASASLARLVPPPYLARGLAPSRATL